MSSRPLRITFLLPTMELSGGVRAVVHHAKCLINRGHQAMIAVPPPRQLWATSKSVSQALQIFFPTEQPTKRMKAIGVPAKTPSPCTDLNLSEIR